jgi:hypothetical protein
LALTEFQRTVCRLLAEQRVASGESYVAGASALNELIGASQISRDIDFFHDTDEALAVSWESDQRVLRSEGLEIRIVRERSSYVEAEISRDGETLLMEWARDSAYRFFPLLQHPDLGLTLHPFDLSTNKVLALVGRLQVRDWVDVIHASERIQPLGYLAWAACGKDAAFSPSGIVEHAARSTHYGRAEILALSFEGTPPDPSDLARRWQASLAAARKIVETLPPAEASRCALNRDGTLFVGGAAALRDALASNALLFHQGSIRGALPRLKSRG